jgi:hypothetical protein
VCEEQSSECFLCEEEPSAPLFAAPDESGEGALACPQSDVNFARRCEGVEALTAGFSRIVRSGTTGSSEMAVSPGYRPDRTKEMRIDSFKVSSGVDGSDRPSPRLASAPDDGVGPKGPILPTEPARLNEELDRLNEGLDRAFFSGCGSASASVRRMLLAFFT